MVLDLIAFAYQNTYFFYFYYNNVSLFKPSSYTLMIQLLCYIISNTGSDD